MDLEAIETGGKPPRKSAPHPRKRSKSESRAEVVGLSSIGSDGRNRRAATDSRLGSGLGVKTATPGLFLRFSTKVADTSGRPVSFIVALVLILLWAASGPLFGFSANWQMVVNTGTTIITFLMVFLLQNAQNRDSRAIQTKLDELILTSQADNRFVGAENLDADELRKVSVQLVQKAGTRIDETPLDEEVGVTTERAGPIKDGQANA